MITSNKQYHAAKEQLGMLNQSLNTPVKNNVYASRMKFRNPPSKISCNFN